MAQDCLQSEAVLSFRRPTPSADSRYFPMQACFGARGYHGEALNAGASLSVFPFNLSDEINRILDRYAPHNFTDPACLVELQGCQNKECRAALP